MIKKFPLSRPLLFLVVGILLGYYLEPTFNATQILVCILFLCLGIFFFSKKIYGIKSIIYFLQLISFLVIGFILIQLSIASREGSFYVKQLKNKDIIKAVVKETAIKKTNSYKTIIQPIKNGNALKGKMVLYIKKEKLEKPIIKYDTLIFRYNPIEFSNQGNPNEFDYVSYLNNRNTYHWQYLTSKDYRSLQYKGNNPLFWIEKLRINIGKIIDNQLQKKDNRAIARALLIGEKSLLNKELKSNFSNVGAIHILAVSGLHVGIILIILNFIFKPLKRLDKNAFAYTIFVLLGVWSFALLSGFSNAVIRAALMFSLMQIGLTLNRKNHSINALIGSAFILLLFDPKALFDVGFQLSYTAVFGILIIQPKIFKLWYIKNRVGKWLWQISTVGVAAQISTLPLTLYYFHQFPLLFWLINPLVIIAATGILIFGFAYLITFWIPYVGGIFILTLNFIISMLNKMIKMTNQFKILKIDTIYFSPLMMVILTLGIILFSNYLYSKEKKRLQNIFVCITVCMLMSFEYKFRINRQQPDQFIVFNEPKKSVYYWDQKFRANIFGLTQGQFIQKHKNFVTKRSIVNFNSMSLDSSKNHSFRSKNKNILITNHQIKNDENIDIMIFSINTPKTILNRIKKDDLIVVLDASITSREHRKWKELLEEAKIKYHSVSNSGAFVLNP